MTASRIACSLLLGLSLGGCSRLPSAPQDGSPALLWNHETNLLANGSFEDGREPWTSLHGSSAPWMDFAVSQDAAQTGDHSALFEVHARGEISRGARIWGVVRDLESDHLPRYVAGSYRVEDWQRGTPKQYVQVVVSLTPPDGGFPEEVRHKKAPLQLAHVLTGIDRPPFGISNRKFVFDGPREPVQDRWIPFRVDLRESYEKEWGLIPDQFATLRILFEARFDGYHPSHGETGARVFFDDLYLGDGE